MVASETPSTGKEIAHSTLQKVNVVTTEGGIAVEITARGSVTPRLTTLASPARLVIDLSNTELATSQSRIVVGHDGVKDLRIAGTGQDAPASRIVVDLDQACSYKLVTESDHSFTVQLHTTATSAKQVSSSETGKTVGAVTAAANSTPQNSTDTQSRAELKAAVVKASHLTTEQPAAGASSFVMVQPTYQTKLAPPTEVSDPPARAASAASKFVEKPDTDLLPSPSAALQPQAAASGSAGFQPAVNMAAEQKAQGQLTPVAVGPKYTGEPISVNLKDVDLKDFFRLIHEISGLNVVLDPNVKGTLTIVLDDVPWDQALDIVLKNNDLDRQLDGNVLRVATLETLRGEADSRRKAQEAEALAVDKFLSQRGDVISDDRTNALIISDIPSVMPGIDRLLTQLDRKTQEVEIEARVVAATRSFARDIGTQLGFGFGNAATSLGGASAVGASSTSTYGFIPQYATVGTSAPSTTTGSQIPLFSNLGVTSPTSGISLTNASSSVRLDATLTMAESRGLLKILSRPRVVTQNNIQAVVKQGTRVPITTLSQLGGPPTVTYVDAFLRLTVVPQITSEKTIFLNVDVENTTPDYSHEVLNNPSLVTQQATTQVLVTDGGTVVIGGVIQTNNSVTINQVPLLGNIPWLGNLFKQTTVSTSSEELIFFITPRIIET